MPEQKYILSILYKDMSKEEYEKEMEKLKVLRDIIYSEHSTEIDALLSQES